MGDVINLNKARKHRASAEKSAKTAANRVRFGRRKSEKELNRTGVERELGKLDGRKLEYER